MNLSDIVYTHIHICTCALESNIPFVLKALAQLRLIYCYR